MHILETFTLAPIRRSRDTLVEWLTRSALRPPPRRPLPVHRAVRPALLKTRSADPADLVALRLVVLRPVGLVALLPVGSVALRLVDLGVLLPVAVHLAVLLLVDSEVRSPEVRLARWLSLLLLRDPPPEVEAALLSR